MNNTHNSSFHYKPLQVETLTYEYRDGLLEKSFTIKKRTSLQQQIRVQTAKIRTRTELKKPIKQKQNLNQTFDYDPVLVHKLISGDQILLRKHKREQTMVFTDSQTKSQYRKQVTTEVIKMLDMQPPHSPKRSNGDLFKRANSSSRRSRVNQSEREEFSKRLEHWGRPLGKDNLDDLNASSQIDEANTQIMIQKNMKKYIDKRNNELAKIVDTTEIFARSPGQISHTGDFEGGFVMKILGIESKETDQELLEKQAQYWAEDRKGRNKQQQQEKRRKILKVKYGQVFNVQVKSRLERMKILLFECVKKMQFMRIDSDQLMSENIILKKPYQREGSYMFFKAIEKGDIDFVKLMLQKCRYYAFDINENLMTALHICARKGHYEIANLLLENGSYPDALDICFRTPLYYAITQNRLQVVKILLYYTCSPWSTEKCQYILRHPDISKFVKMARRLHILKLLAPYSDRQRLWDSYKDVFLQ